MVGFIYTTSGASNTYYFDKNIRGDVIGIYDASGTQIVKYSYDAWGNCTIDSSTTNTALAKTNPIRYRGYYYDEDIKLYYLNSRYYSPLWRRFLSPDSTSYLDPETPNGLNLYAYCNNDPVNYVDPSGHFPEWMSDFGRFIGGLLISAVGIASIGMTIGIGKGLTLFSGLGTLLVSELSLTMYGAFMMASSWDPLIEADMNAIGWNPFNSNPDKSGVNKVSFYKGQPIILQEFGFSSFSAGIMFLDNRNKSNTVTVKHEWGHFAQLLILGPALYISSILLPSALYCHFGDYRNVKSYAQAEKMYFSKVWERTADYLGGVNRNNYYDFWYYKNFLPW